VLPVFQAMQAIGNVSEPEMYRTFNMGVGMVIVVSQTDADAVNSHFQTRGEEVYEIGRVIEGKRIVQFR